MPSRPVEPASEIRAAMESLKRAQRRIAWPAKLGSELAQMISQLDMYAEAIEIGERVVVEDMKR